MFSGLRLSQGKVWAFCYFGRRSLHKILGFPHFCHSPSEVTFILQLIQLRIQHLASIVSHRSFATAVLARFLLLP